jgi:L-amino acid N-acyltransferase YncA
LKAKLTIPIEIKIRPYQIEDTQSILDIINYNILHSTALYDYNIRSFEQQKAILDDKIKKGFPVIVAELDSVVTGFGMYSEFRFREAYKFTVEHSVYVNNNFHGKGIGKIVLTELIALAKKQGLHTMIGVIDAENQSSVDFHEKFGFKTVGIIKESGFKFDRWLHSVFMQLLLE